MVKLHLALPTVWSVFVSRVSAMVNSGALESAETAKFQATCFFYYGHQHRKLSVRIPGPSVRCSALWPSSHGNNRGVTTLLAAMTSAGRTVI